MLLTSCASIRFPAEFFKECEVSYLGPKEATVGDIVRLAEARKYNTLACQADKDAIKAFIKAHPKLGLDK